MRAVKFYGHWISLVCLRLLLLHNLQNREEKNPPKHQSSCCRFSNKSIKKKKKKRGNLCKFVFLPPHRHRHHRARRFKGEKFRGNSKSNCWSSPALLMIRLFLLYFYEFSLFWCDCSFTIIERRCEIARDVRRVQIVRSFLDCIHSDMHMSLACMRPRHDSCLKHLETYNYAFKLFHYLCTQRTCVCFEKPPSCSQLFRISKWELSPRPHRLIHS